MREVMYHVPWQRLRISFLQARRRDGGWSTYEGMSDNLFKLREYLSVSNDISAEEREIRKYRVNNALNAVVMGYSGQKADAKLTNEVRAFRTAFTEGFDSGMVGAEAIFWNWDAQLRMLIELHKQHYDEFCFLLLNLTKRSGNGTAKTRPELYKFLELMRTAQRT
jgi:hypothetical protein